jgi:hypothetical protein
VQATDQVGVSYISEPCGLTAENNLTESAMEEDVLHIELLNRPVVGDSNSEHHANVGWFHNYVESLIVVDPETLSETLEDPSEPCSDQRTRRHEACA